MRRDEIIIKGRIPSKKNSKQFIQRGGKRFLVPSDSFNAWHKEQMIVLKNRWRGRITLEGIKKVDIEFIAPDRRIADLSNKTESLMDLLVDAKIIPDDNWFIIKELNLRMTKVDKEEAGAIITITS